MRVLLVTIAPLYSTVAALPQWVFQSKGISMLYEYSGETDENFVLILLLSRISAILSDIYPYKYNTAALRTSYLLGTRDALSEFVTLVIPRHT